MRFIRTTLLFLAAIYLSGCATVSEPYDYTALLEAKPLSVVVIPPNNASIEVNAPYIYLSTISKPLAEKGYYVFPVAVIENFMRQNGLPTLADMNAVPLDKINEHIGADAVLYINIVDWGQKFLVTSSQTVVKVDLKLVSTFDGQVLWQTQAAAVHSSGGGGGGGIIGAIISAITTQIVSSSIDQTPIVARNANQTAFDDKRRGLLPGPYAPEQPAPQPASTKKSDRTSRRAL